MMRFKPDDHPGAGLRGILAVLLCLLAVAGIPPAGAADDEPTAGDIRQETRELMQALKAYGADKRDDAIEQSRTALDNIDRRIEALEASMLENWDRMDQAARERARASLNALRAQRTEVAEWFGRLQSSTSTAWSQVKQGFSNAYRTMSQTWEKSEQEFHEDN